MTESPKTDIGAHEAKLGTRIRITHIGSAFDQEYVGQTGVVMNVFWPGPHYKIGVCPDSGQYISLCGDDRVVALPDHRDLLKRYMHLVSLHEGVNYIPRSEHDGVPQDPRGPPLSFNEADIAELRAIDDEIIVSQKGLK